MAVNRKKSTAARRRRKKKNAQDSYAGEITLLLMLALSVILLISNFGLGGFLGNAVSTFFFGAFGIASYVFPFFLFLGVAALVVNRENPLVYKKVTAGILFFCFLCALLQMLTQGDTSSWDVRQYYLLSADNHVGGGVVGGLISRLACLAFGVLGAYILLLIGEVIFLILITQRSFFGFCKKVLFGAKEQPKTGKKVKKTAESVYVPEKTADRQTRRGRKKEEAGLLPVNVELTMPDTDDEDPVEEEPLEKAVAEPLDERQEEPAQGKKTIEETVQMSFEIQRGDPSPSEGSKKKEPEMIQPDISTENPAYKFPPFSLLKKGKRVKSGDTEQYLRETAVKLQDALHNFGVNVTVVNVSCGPTVTRYELQPEQGVKVSKIVGLADDIKLNLATADIRIEAPIPGKAAVGIEVPNKENSAVMLRDLLQSQEFQDAKSSLSFAAGKDIAGKPVITDIAKMPHLLIAGATGSGKSVCINTLIMSILYKAKPDAVKLIMVDPKVVELSVYNGIPHLLIPVVTDPKKAAGALNWAVAEMTERYNTFAEYNVRNLADYNQKIQGMTPAEGEEPPKSMPQIVIIVDELADLMMVAPGEVEDAICRLAQLARAAGIHLIIATQRPSVNVITGLIKANMPSRIAFAVSSGVDSRTILDMNGAEKLLGKGDMLFYPQGYQKPARLQGAFVSDEEVSAVVEFLAEKNPVPGCDAQMQDKIVSATAAGSAATSGGEERDAYFVDAGKLIIDKDKASIGMLQRAFKIGFNRAARVMDQLSQANVVGPEEGTKPRKVLMTAEEFEEYIQNM